MYLDGRIPLEDQGLKRLLIGIERFVNEVEKASGDEGFSRDITSLL